MAMPMDLTGVREQLGDTKNTALEAEIAKLKRSTAQYDIRSYISQEKMTSLHERLAHVNADCAGQLAEQDKVVEDLQLQIEIMKKSMEEFKTNAGDIIDGLKLELFEIENPNPCPTKNLDDSEDFSEINFEMKEEYASICDAVAESKLRKMELSEKMTVLMSKIHQLEEFSMSTRQAYKETNSFLKERCEERAILKMNQLNCNPLSEINRDQASLFDEVNDRTVDILTVYNRLKNKFLKAKDILKQNAAKIKALKDERSKYSNLFCDVENKKKAIMEEHERNIMTVLKLHEKYHHCLAFYKKKHEEYPVRVVDKENIFAVVDKLKEEYREEAELYENILNALIQNKILMEQKLYGCERDVAITMRQYHLKKDQCAKLEKELTLIERKISKTDKKI